MYVCVLCVLYDAVSTAYGMCCQNGGGYVVTAISKYHHGVCLCGLREARVLQGSHCPGQALNFGFSGLLLIIALQRSVLVHSQRKFIVMQLLVYLFVKPTKCAVSNTYK
jgi:hypothetical protein